MKNNKILHITTAHQSNDNRIFQKQVSSLKKAGFDISLIAQGNSDEKVNDITIYTVPFSKNRFDRFIFTNLRILLRTIKINPRICHFHDPDFIFSAVILRMLGKKVIYDVHEDVPKQIMSKSWIPKLLRKFIAILFNVIEKISSYFFFSYIVTATDSISKRFNKDKVVVVHNYPRLEEYENISVDYLNRENAIIYIGGISRIRGVNEMIDAFLKLKTQNVKFYLAGPFDNNNLKNNILDKINSIPNIEYLGFLNRVEVARYLSQSRLGLVLFHPEPNHIEAGPNKIFEYMSAKLPVLGSNFDLWKSIIINNNCGLLVDPLDSDKIAESIDWVLNNQEKAQVFGENGRNMVSTKFNWKVEENKLIGLYNKLLDRD